MSHMIGARKIGDRENGTEKQQICKEGVREVAKSQKRGRRSKKFGNLCVRKLNFN